MAFLALETIEHLDEVFRSSFSAPIVLLKHSSSCGISSNIFDDLSRLESDIYLVVVQRNRDVSDKISRMTGQVHESPQAFVISDGKPIYSASHYDIERANIERILMETLAGSSDL